VIARDGSGERTLGAVGVSPTWAPDGSAIAVVGLGYDGIYLVDPDGVSAPLQVVSGPVLTAAWSPDGQSLAFVRGSIGDGRVSVVRRDGSGEHAVGGEGSVAPVWAPDGRTLAYVLQRPETGHGDALILVTGELHIVRPDGSGDRTLDAVRLQRIAMPVWTRGGRSLVYSGEIRVNDPEIYVVRPDGKGLRALTHNLLDDIDPTWSPDHRRIAFTRGRWEVTWERAPADPAIYVMSGDGTGARRIASGTDPAWSPDGAKIAFDDGDNVYVVAARGGGRRVVARDREWRSTDPTWSPDGRRIVFVRAGRIMIASARGGRARFLTKPPGWDSTPAWSPDGSSIAVNRTRDICIVSVTDRRTRCLTRGGKSEAPAWSPDGSQIIFDTWVYPPGHSVLEVARLHGGTHVEWSAPGDAFYPDW
jgi:TolB protein